MWRGGFRLGLSVTGPFGCRCLTSLAVLRFHIPLIKPGVRFSRTRLSDKALFDVLLHTFAHETIAARFVGVGGVPALGTDIRQGNVDVPDPAP